MEFHPQDHPTKTKPSPKKRFLKLITFISILLSILLAIAWFLLTPAKENLNRAEIITSVEIGRKNVVEHQALQDPSSEPIVNKNEQPGKKQLSPVSDQALPLVAKEDLSRQQQCTRLTGSLETFFNDLDKKPYIKAFKLEQPCLQLFNKLSKKLLANPPVVIRETNDLYTILTNMAHFFRIIGRRNILLMKGILDRESDKIEDIAAELYTWTIVNQCTDEKERLQLEIPLEKVYEYAGFFLNTMGGRSYLFRRDSRSRLLVNYYAILIIDRANKENINRYGLDISTTLPRLIQEIESTNLLIYKEDYLDSLYGLQEKYQPVSSEQKKEIPEGISFINSINIEVVLT